MNKPLVLAGIDIGSNAVKIKIIEYNKSQIKTLVDLSTDVTLGDEVFRDHLISVESQENLEEILLYFARLMKEYDVDDYVAVATSSFRRAENRHFVANQMKRRTGIAIQVIEDSYEKFITYKSMKDSVKEYKNFRQKGTVLVELTSGGCDVTLYRNDKLLRNDEIGIGSQTLKNKLKAFLKTTPNYMDALESYIETKIDYISKLLKKKSIEYYLAVGGEIKTIRDLFFEGKESITREDYLDFFNEVQDNNQRLVKKSMEGGRDWIEMLASIIFFKVFLEVLNCKEIKIPEITLREGLIAQLIDKHFPEEERYKSFNEDPFHASYMMAKRFGIHTSHAKYIEQGAVKLIDALREAYNFNERDIAMARHAAHLHEIGKSIDLTNYYRASQNMVRSMRLFSLREVEQERIYQILSTMNAFYDERDTYYEKPLVDVKLACVLLLMDALDASKKQHIKLLQILLDDHTLRLAYKEGEDVTIEREALAEIKPFFKQIFGLELSMEEQS